MWSSSTRELKRNAVSTGRNSGSANRFLPNPELLLPSEAYEVAEEKSRIAAINDRYLYIYSKPLVDEPVV